MTQIEIPSDLRPGDGRFGSGPSKIRDEAVAALAKVAHDYLGTSHRQAGVRSVVARVKEGLSDLYDLPDGHEVLLGVGGATAFWDAMAFGLIERKSCHAVFGEFSSKCAAAAEAPHLDAPAIVSAEPGSHPVLHAHDGVDLYATAHNETSTGVMMPVVRPAPQAFVAIDATSAAGGVLVDLGECDVYYFAPQKCFASDGGLWIAIASPGAIERIEKIAASDRWIPASLDLKIALDNSRKDQTYNTPALATLYLMAEQIDWFRANGGLSWAAGRSKESSDALYAWAGAHEHATPFVAIPEQRSTVVGTIDFDDAVDAAAVAKVLRSNGILDTEPYRKLGRNQLRIACYPAIEPDDIRTLTKAIDYVIDAL